MSAIQAMVQTISPLKLIQEWDVFFRLRKCAETKQRHDIGFTMKRTTTVVDNRGDLVIDFFCMVVIEIVHDGVWVQAGAVNVLHNCGASVSEFV